ncbi:MAG TPA: hypothetical protein VGF70_06335 [Solirubrobacteraceae bacterium]|jgi:hypothetical protein
MAGVNHPRWRTATRACIALVCALACLTAVTSAAQAATPPAISAVNAFSALQLPLAGLTPQLAAIQGHGVTTVRGDAPWGQIEPAPPGPLGHVWQWATTDARVAALAAHHLTWQPVLDYSVWWAKTCPGFCAPSSNSTYAAFAQAVAARYGAGGSFWAQNPQLPYRPVQIFEIWNEENVSTYSIPATQYGPLYSAARTAIHAVDPQADVIIGGLADDGQAFNASQDYPKWFINQLFTADPSLVGQVDGFGLHPYGANASAVEQWVVDFRNALTSWNEGSAPIYITEIGWQTGSTTTETWRAQQMSSVALTLSHSNCGIAYMAPYTWINPLSLNEPGDFGLVDRSALTTTLRPAGTAWFNGLTQAASHPVNALCPAQASTTQATTPSTTASSTKTKTGARTASVTSSRVRHHRRHRRHRRHHRRQHA